MGKGNGGDFHQGVPNKHEGKKGDTSDDVRSSAEKRRADAGELNIQRPENTGGRKARKED